jgi:DNA-directed RNA polymerase specialized sigma24 family protein
MKVYKSAARYRPRSKFQIYLYTIAKNTCLNELWRHREQMVSLDEPVAALCLCGLISETF